MIITNSGKEAIDGEILSRIQAMGKRLNDVEPSKIEDSISKTQMKSRTNRPKKPVEIIDTVDEILGQIRARANQPAPLPFIETPQTTMNVLSTFPKIDEDTRQRMSKILNLEPDTIEYVKPKTVDFNLLQVHMVGEPIMSSNKTAAFDDAMSIVGKSF